MSKELRFKIFSSCLLVAVWCSTASGQGRSARPTFSIKIVKEGPEEIGLGQAAAKYLLHVMNNGKIAANDVTVRLHVPAGMTYRNLAEIETLRWNLGTLEPASHFTIQYTAGSTRTGTFLTAVEVLVKGAAVNRLTFQTRVVAPDVRLRKNTDQRIVFLHRSLNYTITVTNAGDGAAEAVELVDLLPPQVEYVESTPRGDFKPARGGQPATITWQLGTVEPKRTVELTLITRAKDSGRAVNSITLTSRSAPPLEAVVVSEIQKLPQLHISTYDSEDPVAVGKQTTYVIEVRNEGTQPATNVRLESRIPGEMQFVSADGPTRFTLQTSMVQFEPIAVMKPGDKVTFRVVCRAVQSGFAKHTAVVRYDQFEGPIMDEEGTDIYGDGK